jgi:branched-chain amino acid transport system permease protein
MVDVLGTGAPDSRLDRPAAAPTSSARERAGHGAAARSLLAALAFLAVAGLPPLLLDSVWNFTLALALIYGLMGLSVVVVTGFVGQLSLMPATFVGVGAFLSAGLVTRASTPFWGAALLAALFTVPVALVIGMVALRLRGLYLAIMTLVFADVVEQVLFHQTWFTGEGGSSAAPRPHLFTWVDFSSDKSYYVLVVCVVSAFLLLVSNFSRSRAARACYAVRDNEAAASAMGINVARYKLLAFSLHGFIAGSAGVLFAHWAQNVSAGGQRPAFGLEASLAVLFLTILGGVRSIWGPFVGGVVWVVLTKRLLSGSPIGQSVAFAVFGALVVVTMLYRPSGMAGWAGDVWRTVRARLARGAG